MQFVAILVTGRANVHRWLWLWFVFLVFVRDDYSGRCRRLGGQVCGHRVGRRRVFTGRIRLIHIRTTTGCNVDLIQSTTARFVAVQSIRPTQRIGKVLALPTTTDNDGAGKHPDRKNGQSTDEKDNDLEYGEFRGWGRASTGIGDGRRTKLAVWTGETRIANASRMPASSSKQKRTKKKGKQQQQQQRGWVCERQVTIREARWRPRGVGVCVSTYGSLAATRFLHVPPLTQNDKGADSIAAMESSVQMSLTGCSQ